MSMFDELKFDQQGLIAVVLQDAHSGAVLTLAYANREALERTFSTRQTHLYSRSRQELWHKGATSGHTQHVVSMHVDCDHDAVLYRVVPAGPACHTGTPSCFSKEIPMGNEADFPPGNAPSTVPTENQQATSAAFAGAMQQLQTVIAARRTASPDSSYVAKLLTRGVDAIAKKIGEEATEVVIAAKNADRKEIIWEVADLLFHTVVMLEATGVTLDEIGHELLRRAK